MISAIYLMFYLLTTAGLGLFWVARMDLPAFDLHYLFGYCLLFLVAVHLWFQLPMVFMWLKKNSPPALLDATHTEWKPRVRILFLIIVTLLLGSAISIIIYEFMTPVTKTVIESSSEIPIGQRIWLVSQDKKIDAVSYINHRADITRETMFSPRFNFTKPEAFKQYPDDSIVALPTPDASSGTSLTQALSQDSVNSVAPLNVQNLSNILYYSSGVTGKIVYPGGQLLLRAAASAGALYPNDLYVAVIKVDGLQAGIYYYHPGHHNLIKIGNQDSLHSLSSASAYPDLQKNTAAIIMVTANFDRTIWKYGERSFRYILPDAGHILSNIAIAAASIRIPFANTAFFDDEKMNNALGLSQQDEGVLSMVVLGKNKLTEQTDIPQFTAANLPGEVQHIELTRLSYRLTSVQWKKGSMRTPNIDLKKYGSDTPAANELIRLPAGSATNDDTFTSIKNRRSFRQYSREDVSLEDFAGIIQQSFAPLENPHMVEAGRRVELFVIVSKVKGLSQGVYRYIPEEAALEKIREGDFSNAIYKAGLSQELLERAAFVIAWTIDLKRIGPLHGERDYRYANLECGLGSETSYLAAQARGMGACAVGAFYDDELRNILDIDKTAKQVILLTAVGNKP